MEPRLSRAGDLQDPRAVPTAVTCALVVLDQALNDRNDGLNCLPAMTGDNPLAPFPLYESKAQLAGAALNFLVSSRPEGVSRPGTAARTVETDITRIIPSGRFRRGRRAAAAPRPATPPPPRPVARGSASAGFFATASTRPASATSTTGSRRTTAAATRPASGGGASTRSKLYCDM